MCKKYFNILLMFCLQEENPETSMLFLQLPPTVPLMKRSTTTDGQEISKSSAAPKVANTSQKSCALNELPAGFVGKMLVYKSGAMKLKIGDTLYDVSRFCDQCFYEYPLSHGLYFKPLDIICLAFN